MEPLSKVLKGIYTSGDKKTVLQLLKTMIEEIEKYEVRNIVLYHHTMHVRGTDFKVYFEFYSASDTPIEDLETLDETIARYGNMFVANGYIDLNQEGTLYPIQRVRPGNTDTNFGIVYLTDLASVNDYVTPTVIVDNVSVVGGE